MGIYKRPDSPFYWYSFKLNWMNRQVCGSTETIDKKLAQAIFHQKRTEYQEGRVYKRGPILQFFDMVSEYLIARRSEKKASYEMDLVRFELFKKYFGNIPVKEIDAKKLEAYRWWRLKQVKEPTVNRDMAALKRCFNQTLKWERQKDNPAIIYNPVCDIKFYPEEERARQRFITQEEKIKLLPYMSERLRNLVIVAMKTGLRQGEQLRLKWADLDFENNRILVRKSKARKQRRIPMHEDVKFIFNRLPRTGEYVFCDSEGKPYSRHGFIRSEFELAAQKLGIDNLVYHDLRHTFGSDLAAAGASAKMIKEFMGHSSLKMTDRYMHYSKSQEDEIINNLKSDIYYAGTTLEESFQKASVSS